MFLPKEKKFYGLFEAMAEKLSQAGILLKKLVEEQEPENIEKIALEMKKLESEADDIGHETASNLHKAFITPIEGEDIDILRQNLDDVIDGIERVVNRIQIYNIGASFFEKIKDYIEIICQAIEEIKESVKELRNFKKYSKNILERCEKINKLENEGDDLNRTTLKRLMNPDSISSPTETLEIIKQKEIFETLEDTIDCCEDVANVFEAIIIKNS